MRDVFKAMLITARTELEKAANLPDLDGPDVWYLSDLIDELSGLIDRETPDERDASIDQEISDINR